MEGETGGNGVGVAVWGVRSRDTLGDRLVDGIFWFQRGNFEVFSGCDFFSKGRVCFCGFFLVLWVVFWWG